MRFSGAVLAGGRSSRFGQDKARFVYRGRALLEWVLLSLEEADERFVVAKRVYPEFGVPVYADLVEAGPLGGLYTALRRAAAPWVAVAACDLPHLRREYWAFLLSWAYDRPVIPLDEQGRLQPLAGLYPTALASSLEAALYRGARSLKGFLREVGYREIPWEHLVPFGSSLLLNANRPEDLGSM
jgi:molybdopterin-guanine dinucleotide biosynthesis protein A